MKTTTGPRYHGTLQVKLKQRHSGMVVKVRSGKSLEEHGARGKVSHIGPKQSEDLPQDRKGKPPRTSGQKAHSHTNEIRNTVRLHGEAERRKKPGNHGQTDKHPDERTHGKQPVQPGQ